MRATGIDVGHHSAKAIIIEDGKILSEAITAISVGGSRAAEEALDQALRGANLAREEIDYTIATGHGRKGVTITQESKPLALCLARGIRWLLPSVKTAIDVGAEVCNIIGMDDSGRIIDFQENDKCASGGGIFLESMAKFFKLTPKEMSKMALKSKTPIRLSAQCVIFSEQELITHIHSDNPSQPEDIFAGIYHALATRVAGLTMRVRIREDIALSGGVANSPAFVKAMEEELGVKLNVPKNPEMVLALGASLFALESIIRREK